MFLRSAPQFLQREYRWKGKMAGKGNEKAVGKARDSNEWTGMELIIVRRGGARDTEHLEFYR